MIFGFVEVAYKWRSKVLQWRAYGPWLTSN